MPSVTPFIGSSPAIRSIEEEAEYASRCDAKVLLTGESGVGKEVVARLIHNGSARRNAPFVTLNCAGVPDTLLESELFGHERGSFTGAYRDKPGILEAADHGVVFLDEIGEMSVRMQGMLLRFLESGELQRVGATTMLRRIDVRVIAATNRNLLERIRDGAFRDDLYFRLNVIHVVIPPLRERRDDILPLMEHFLAEFSTSAGTAVPRLTDAARDALVHYAWPGNVRELRNIAERLVVRNKATVTPAELNLLVGVRTAGQVQMPPPTPSMAGEVFERIVTQGESFWSAAYPAFMARDMTRADLRNIVKMGLEETRGNYKMLVQLFNMPPTDYKRFLAFLRKHHCHMPFQSYRNSIPRRQVAVNDAQ
jgi:transcriptional regulator with PAS, ATPase and Fis domain